MNVLILMSAKAQKQLLAIKMRNATMISLAIDASATSLIFMVTGKTAIIMVRCYCYDFGPSTLTPSDRPLQIHVGIKAIVTRGRPVS